MVGVVAMVVIEVRATRVAGVVVYARPQIIAVANAGLLIESTMRPRLLIVPAARAWGQIVLVVFAVPLTLPVRSGTKGAVNATVFWTTAIAAGK